ncbi:hypothetical protein AAVH_39978 [Aphelenchoides avenae]|nr:hypothetical protein AAVH_39978 [Aphelenchus avenae]
MSSARPIYGDGNVESSEDELEEGEIASDSEIGNVESSEDELEEGEIVRDSENEEATDSEIIEETSGAVEAGTSSGAIGGHDLSDDDSLEEGEIVSDSDNEGNDEDVVQDDVIDREINNSVDEQNDFDANDSENEEAPGPDDPELEPELEPATDDRMESLRRSDPGARNACT